MNEKELFSYYEIENTISEYCSSVTGRYLTEDIAKENLKDKCDWYCDNGTGTIYQVWFTVDDNGIIKRHREKVYSKRW